MLPSPGRSLRSRALLKRFMYSQLSLLDAGKILLGREQPRVPFTVLSDPASVYYNFRISPAAREAFVRHINLPDGFEMTPIHCLQGEQSDYLLTLNVYEVSGIATGIRAEWSTYIRDARGVPRYMVLEARSSTLSMDPVDVVTRRSQVEHCTRERLTRTSVASFEGRLFSACYELPSEPAAARIHPEWIAANDFIYWRNGVCDRTFYDAGLAFPDASLIEPGSVDIDDRTHWVEFVESVPKHVVQFVNPIEFVIMPWYNVSVPGGAV